MEVGNKKKQYGLQLQIKPQKPASRPAVASAFRFDGGDDGKTVEDDIAKQAGKKRNMRDVEEQYKKALEEDPSAFDYDGVYDQMKGNQARPIQEDRAKREPKYIGKLMEKAKQRAREHDIVYERQLAKERAKEDHLFGDKEKFVTSAYKKKLMEDAKWLEEERVRELREQKHEVGNKSDMSDFYRNLLKNNEAFGGRNLSKPTEKSSTPTSKEAEQPEAIPSTAQAAELGQNRTGLREEERDSEISHGEHEIRKGRNPNLSPHSQLQRKDGADEDGVNASRPSLQDKSKRNTGERPLEESVEVKPSLPSPTEVAPAVDPVVAARERYLARKRQRG